jgi:minor pilin subunit PapK
MRGIIACLILQTMVLLSFTGIARADVTFQGNLLDRPCHIDPASQTQDVEFLDTATPLYRVWPGKSSVKTFRVALINCYASSIGKVVRLTFSGAQESGLPGYLAVNGVNAGRLGIGLLDTDGSSLLKLGDAHNHGAGDVVSGSTLTLNFGAFVQVTPTALAQKSVVPGDYGATATFELNYL